MLWNTNGARSANLIPRPMRGRNCDEESVERAVNACVFDRNATAAAVDWRLNASHPRTNLHRLYSGQS